MLLNEMEIFFYVVELKSFSQAADRLNVSKSFISKKITLLEKQLKTRLITRSTRQLTLTEAGQNFYAYCSTIVKEAGNAFSLMHQLRGKPSGTLKISMPPAVGLHLLTPLLTNFSQQYPEVHLNIQLETRLVDLIEEGYDLAIRSARLASSNLIAQKIYSWRNVIVASKKYWQAHGMPKKPQDLKKHHFAVYSGSQNNQQIILEKGRQQEIIDIKNAFACNQLELIKNMLLNDCYVAYLPEYTVTEELHKKLLVTCLDDYSTLRSEFYAVYPEREFMPPKLKVFLQMLKEYLHGLSA